MERDVLDASVTAETNEPLMGLHLARGFPTDVTHHAAALASPDSVELFWIIRGPNDGHVLSIDGNQRLTAPRADTLLMAGKFSTPDAYSPPSRFPGSDSHLELHGPAHGSDHNSNGTPMVGPATGYDVLDHAGPASRPPFTDPSSW